ncbi:PepSY-like domain-containing protein [uncultured Bacteroides sp.]|uniref:PepSY-like domain-containing protein n=1 Tax=uncultured Bacteroides sp. TaxID=162156 RepID=UPI002675B0D6|nr:PepSY-like domain-containing protein [uncultured Bacteroides sp.]
MKKLILLLACVFSFQLAMADNDVPITFEQLPAKAQTFIKQNFPDIKVAFAKMEKEWFDSSYDVIFINGDKLEFDKNGEWKEMKCKRMGVPEKAVPAQILKFVKENYPDAKILRLEKDRYEYEVKLSNFWEITFDLKFNVIDLDNDND